MIFAVGEKTKQTVEKFGLKVTAVPETFTAHDLSTMLQREDLHGTTFLFPCGNLSSNSFSEKLKTLGAHVDPLIVYCNKRPNPTDVNITRSKLTNGTIDVVTFTSPSTFKNFCSLFPEDYRHLNRYTKIASIGPATQRAIEDGGLDVDILAEESTVEGIVRSIVMYFESELEKRQTVS
jgi:uroporphyrinogen-III synthase